MSASPPRLQMGERPPILVADKDAPLVPLPKYQNFQSPRMPIALPIPQPIPISKQKVNFTGLLPLPPELLSPTKSIKKPRLVAPAADAAVKKGPIHRGRQTSAEGDTKDEWYDLPDGWRKMCIFRKSGSTVGDYDIYLLPPNNARKLRSSMDILRFVQTFPSIPLNPYYVNMERPVDQTGAVSNANKTRTLGDAIDKVRLTGVLPENIRFKAKKNVKRNLTSVKSVGPQPKPSTKAAKKKKRLKITQEKVIQLEKYFYGQACVPTIDQVKQWSEQLRLDHIYVMKWFRAKWKAKLEYEANAELLRIRSSGIDPASAFSMCYPEPEVVSELQVGSPEWELVEGGSLWAARKPLKFDVGASPLAETLDITDGDNYVIEYGNGYGEEDSDDEVVIVEENCDDGEILIEDDGWMSHEDSVTAVRQFGEPSALKIADHRSVKDLEQEASSNSVTSEAYIQDMASDKSESAGNVVTLSRSEPEAESCRTSASQSAEDAEETRVVNINHSSEDLSVDKVRNAKLKSPYPIEELEDEIVGGC